MSSRKRPRRVVSKEDPPSTTNADVVASPPSDLPLAPTGQGGSEPRAVESNVTMLAVPTPAPPMRVVHLAAELAPYARTGGLGEAVAVLAQFQARAGLDVAILVPFYREIVERNLDVKAIGSAFTVVIAGRRDEAQLYELTTPNAGPKPRVYFVAHRGYFDRDGIYGDARGEFGDNARRFAFFCVAALQALPRLMPAPVVVHAHDWHAALAPVYLRSWMRGHPYYDRVASVLSVHNAGFQGHFPTETMADLGIPWDWYTMQRMEWHGRVNFVKGGMAAADAVTTVSATHADELRTPDGGFGLQGAFVGLAGRFVGITNGIDHSVWDPATDTHIAATYSTDDLSGKMACKAALQRAFRLPESPRTPLFAMSARMVYQKGLDLILDSGFLDLDAQFVFLGHGEPRYVRALETLASRAPHKLAVVTKFTDTLEHRLLAGADLLLMPSLYEPCGLTQMRAQRYGTLPVARRVGGLADTIDDDVTGFLFDDYTSRDFAQGVVRALRAYAHPPHWTWMQQTAMERNFGWEQAERKYEAVYRFAVQRRTG
jgi:starch synthase